MRIVAIYNIHLVDKNYHHKQNLGFVNFFHRSSVQALLDEFALHAASKLQNPERKIYEHSDFQFLCYRYGENACILITDLEYPSRVSFDLLNHAMHQDSSEKYLEYVVEQCQNPCTIDRLTKVQHQLDETLVIMHENVNRVLERGDSIDKLVEKSERLSQSSKMFYKVARKHNRCCHIQ